ncbi:1-deoxy-D-xylulose 5-phosphate reductoisomerase [Arcticibacter tournemirensis]|uniref:1-deoxy-D-xylulose 5-phosphate reductoisomerase n=1 Tax=Arcticibacter tournemirensis TaxID=699437 RepID=A0A4Q0M8W6_9SPHI|nr:1-deoxy-D-xylulose-5-phosphate reductoisomerase [Arcticibacter tournemirensis]KAA8483776.1 1-deoxy-D-xylulose-5-phosphate reductoisomerase [Arcticibacter tournemirensis]RXF69628.1 1-deoxy-D-xylulose-5-phosphate reductoisomerase [Arcticibacter tournemirensis]TQM50022.1 1-deoxy-D-xylulose 5-phosphate reductoisomerase [Arcticibacter tournemirensis]
MVKLKNVAILGSSGSIGTQALEVIRENPDLFRVSVLTVNTSASLLVQQALEFRPQKVVIVDESQYDDVRLALEGSGVEVYAGEEALTDVVQTPEIDVVLTALVGFCGLLPTIAAIRAGKDIALANKETLVVAGGLVNALAKEHNIRILPVDSEHSAIFQCLTGEAENPIEKIYLTASGGPFRGKNRSFLESVTKEDALKHPNWVMGAKITVDSATLMNKGLEVIEARWLFDLEPSQIDVIVHPQSIIHSIVQFGDGSMKAQMGLPDMKLPIQYALGFPRRINNRFPRFDFLKYPELTFEQPDRVTFRNLELAFNALEAGGNMPCVLNAANEIAVAEFLSGRVGFLGMSRVIERCMNEVSYIRRPLLQDYIETDKETRIIAQQLVTNF